MPESPIRARIERVMAEKAQKSLVRSLAQVQPSRIDLATNSYLALHANPVVIERARALAATGAGGNLASRIVACQSPLYDELERELAAWKKTEAAILFSSGYAANVGVLQALCTRDTEVFCDRLNHASIIDGIRLAGAKLERYRHVDMTDLAARLAASSAPEKVIVTDTIFSMDGDTAPLADIVELGRKYNCLMVVDEAHASGVLGDNLGGLADQGGLSGAIDVTVGTLSKAVAGLGGFVSCDKQIGSYLVNHSRSLIYSTGLPHDVLAWNLAAVRLIRESPKMGPDLLDRAAIFREELLALGFSTGTSSTQIVPCIVSGNETALDLSRFLLTRGIKAPAIRSPTVPAGTERIRFSVHSGFTSENALEVRTALRDWNRLHG